jgi:putative endonuclease
MTPHSISFTSSFLLFSSSQGCVGRVRPSVAVTGREVSGGRVEEGRVRGETYGPLGHPRQLSAGIHLEKTSGVRRQGQQWKDRHSGWMKDHKCRKCLNFFRHPRLPILSSPPEVSGDPSLRNDQNSLRVYFGQQTVWHLIIGVTSHLIKRYWEHQQGFTAGFTNTYDVHRLVYYELHSDMTFAITREKQLKRWKRTWKLQLIEKHNPDWRDLWEEIVA